MSDDWDADDFEIKLPPVMKSNWEDEEIVEAALKESEKTQELSSSSRSIDTKPREKKDKSKIDETKSSGIELRELTEDEKKAAQEAADLRHSLALMGLDKSLDEISLESKDEVNNYIDRLYARLNKYNTHANYFDLLDGLLKNLSKNLSTDIIRKLSKSYQKFADQKMAEEKERQAQEARANAKPTKGAHKKTVKVERDNDFNNFRAGGGGGGEVYDDFDEDDFM